MPPVEGAGAEGDAVGRLRESAAAAGAGTGAGVSEAVLRWTELLSVGCGTGTGGVPVEPVFVGAGVSETAFRWTGLPSVGAGVAGRGPGAGGVLAELVCVGAGVSEAALRWTGLPSVGAGAARRGPVTGGVPAERVSSARACLKQPSAGRSCCPWVRGPPGAERLPVACLRNSCSAAPTVRNPSSPVRRARSTAATGPARCSSRPASGRSRGSEKPVTAEAWRGKRAVPSMRQGGHPRGSRPAVRRSTAMVAGDGEGTPTADSGAGRVPCEGVGAVTGAEPEGVPSGRAG